VKLLPFLREDLRPPEGREQVHQAARGDAFLRKPPEVKLLSETSSASYRKPPEVKLPEGSETSSERECFL
jgi:hypothetical protein